jgi:hypothetical protein
VSDYEGKHEGPPADEEPVIGDAPPTSKTFLSNDVYDKMKPVVRIWLPALAVFYIAIAPLWGFPKQEEVSGTIMALDLLLGTVLQISNKQYLKSDARFDGAIHVLPGEDEDSSAINVQLDPVALMHKDEVTVRVHK